MLSRAKNLLWYLCADGPMFVSEPRDQLADIGDQSATMSCIVDSRPQASMSWTLGHGSAMRVLSRAETLVISPVTVGNFTSYRCTASVSGFTSVTRIVRLRRTGEFINHVYSLVMLLITSITPFGKMSFPTTGVALYVVCSLFVLADSIATQCDNLLS